MEFKWLRTLTWGQNRSADDFPTDLCRNQNNGKDREWNGALEVGSTSCFSNETLYRRLQSFEKVHHTLKQLISTTGDMAVLLGRTFKWQLCLLWGLLKFLSIALQAGYLAFVPQIHPPWLCCVPVWTTSPGSLALPFLVAFSQLGVVAWCCGAGESEVRGFSLQAPPCQVNLDCLFVWWKKQLPQDGCSHCCSLGSADCSLLRPSLRNGTSSLLLLALWFWALLCEFPKPWPSLCKWSLP